MTGAVAGGASIGPAGHLRAASGSWARSVAIARYGLPHGVDGSTGTAPAFDHARSIRERSARQVRGRTTRVVLRSLPGPRPTRVSATVSLMATPDLPAGPHDR